MKSLPALLLFPWLAASAVLAQGSGIHATATLHPDNTRSTMVVDADKRTAEETLEDDKGRVLRKTTFLMDDRNQYLGSITSDPKGNVLYRTAFRYDAAGRVEEEAISNANSEPLRKRVYVYGANNKVLNMVEYDGKGNVISSGKRKSDPLAPVQAGGQPTPTVKRGRK